MKQTYNEAITRVFEDEGGYTNDPRDPGGPTNWGITIGDAKAYWKKDATATDVRNMPKSVAEDIYKTKYAAPLNYDNLPPGVDYAVLDYGINSGNSRSARVLKKVQTNDPIATINAIYDERLAFLQSLSTWPVFGRGWGSRCARGRTLALSLYSRYHNTTSQVPAKHAASGVILGAGATALTQTPHHQWPYIIGGTLLAALAVWLGIHFIDKGK